MLDEVHNSMCVQSVDSGSPLMLLDMPRYDARRGDPTLDFLVGMNIDGAPCGAPGKPDIYIDIGLHADWIENTIESFPSGAGLGAM